MSFLDEYKRLAESETDNEFPEQMEHDGLSESDRDMYEEVLNKMRSDMDKANEEMKKNAKSWGDVCHTTENGGIQNNTYKMDEAMLRSKVIQTPDGKMRPVSEPLGLMVDTFRCPKCGKLMYEYNGKFECRNCGYSENSDSHMQFYFIDNTYSKTPLPSYYNDKLCQAFAMGHYN